MTQNSLWQKEQHNADYAELCNALYERELRLLTKTEFSSAQPLQARLKSLPHYINRTAFLMTKVAAKGDSPLALDVQNASWAVTQNASLPLSGQEFDKVHTWYLSKKLTLGLVIPIAVKDHILLDCIDRIDTNKQRFRTNVYGWFNLNETTPECEFSLLKPNKKVMAAACAGHRWQSRGKAIPIMPSLRELLLSCSVNWKNFRQPLVL